MKTNFVSEAKGPAFFVLLVLAGAALGWLIIPTPGPKPRVPRKDESALAAGRVQHVSDAIFGQEVLSSPVPVLVDFYADWCGPCMELEPVIEELAHETPNARFVKVNVDRELALAARYGVTSIPRLLVFRNGQIAADHTGSADKGRLREMLGL